MAEVFERYELEGKYVRLEPLSLNHLEGLKKVVAEGDLYQSFVTVIPAPDHVEQFINNAQAAYEAGDGLAFAIIDLASGEVAGTTRYTHANNAHGCVEIGYTFLGHRYQKSPINTNTKALLLKYAFDGLGMIRVQFITDYLNQNSRRALERMGAKQEGILRNHMIMPDGRIRDSVMFSIIANEWIGVEQNLIYKLSQSYK